jgi:peptidoglycan/LPS O-acetylase OafA/YrhL
MHWPLLNLWMSGRGMIDIFFLISGYVLSYQMLKHIRTKETESLMKSLASANFRRFLRLYVSCGVATFGYALLSHIGWMPGREINSVFERLMDWAWDLLKLSNPFASLTGFYHSSHLTSAYIGTLWTIPLEFRGSLVIYSFCAMTSRLSTLHRMLLCWMLIVLCFIWQATYIIGFLTGLFLADLSFSRHPERLGIKSTLPQITNNQAQFSTKPPFIKRIFYSAMLFCGIFLLAQPNIRQEGFWPWPLLDRLVPSFYVTQLGGHLFACVGSYLVVEALEAYSTLQCPLLWNFSQYIGDLSFGIYVTHPFIMRGVQDNILRPLNTQYTGGSEWGKLLILIVDYFLILWASDLFSRVDKKVVRFGRWLEEQLFEY